MYNFIGTEAAFAQVKEELSSYFDSGALDDALFPRWAEQAIRKFKKSGNPIKQVFLPLCNYTADLPSDFNSVREVWACGVLYNQAIPNPTSYYYQRDCRITVLDDSCGECWEDDQQTCTPLDKRFAVTHKITGVTLAQCYYKTLLRPGNRNAYDKCGAHCPNIGCDSQLTFDIRDCKIITDFRDGGIHLEYYSDNTSEDGELLIPDLVEVEDYLMKYLKYKCFEQLSNIVTDETFNQIASKLQKAEIDKNQAFVTAETELKKITKYQVQDLIDQRKNRFNFYRRSIR